MLPWIYSEKDKKESQKSNVILAPFVHLQQGLIIEDGYIFLNLVRIAVLYGISNCIAVSFSEA